MSVGVISYLYMIVYDCICIWYLYLKIATHLFIPFSTVLKVLPSHRRIAALFGGRTHEPTGVFLSRGNCWNV